MLKNTWKVPAIVALVGAVAACSDTTNPLAGRGQMVSLSLATVGAVPAPVGPFAAPAYALAAGDTLVVAQGSDTLRITSIEVVMREIELHRVTTAVDCDSTANADDCEEFESGIQLVALPLGAGIAMMVNVPIDSGTYDKVEFEMHKPGGDSADAAFLLAHPEFTNVTIRVRGTFNGTAFTYTTPMNQEVEYQFSTPLVIDASGSATNLTLRMDVRRWFRVGGTATGALIDPASANVGQPNEGAVNENIKNTIEAFEDEDRDGGIN